MRDTITLGIKRLQKMDSKKERFKAASISGAGKVQRFLELGSVLARATPNPDPNPSPNPDPNPQPEPQPQPQPQPQP